MSGAFAQAPNTRQQLPLELEWRAPPDCPSQPQVRAEVERIVRARPGSSLPALRVRGEVSRARTQYRILLEVRRADESTRREFQSESCKALMRAATLSIALSFGDGADISEASPLEEQPRPAPPAPAVPPPRPAPAREARQLTPLADIEQHRFVALGVGGAWSPSWLGGNAFGVQAAASLRWKRGTLSWTNRGWFPRTLHVNDSVSARFWAATTSLAPGLRHRFGALELELALGLQIGVIHGAGADIRSPAQTFAPWYALAPSLGVALELGRGVRVALVQEFVLAPAPPEFDIAPIGIVYRAPSFTPVTALSLPIDVAPF